MHETARAESPQPVLGNRSFVASKEKSNVLGDPFKAASRVASYMLSDLPRTQVLLLHLGGEG